MPLTALLMVLMLIALFYHAALGLQVIIEDYIHSAAKLPAILLIRFTCFGLAAAGILAVLRIALGSFR
jgi:succinate dehydrogenase / fumarate reductase membrane anchor subunit